MAKQIDYLVLSYPNFVLGQIIDPDEANQNNADIAGKVNEFVDEVKEALDLADGANTKSTQALATANTAKSTADSAIANANSAVANASTALTKATGVEVDYNTLKPQLQQAITDANNAVSTIDSTINATVFNRVGISVSKGAFVATADGVTTFTVPSNMYNPLYDEIEVVYGGVRLEPGDNYSMSNRDIVLTFPINTGESIQYRASKNTVVNPSLTDGAFLKDASINRVKLDTALTAELDGKSTNAYVNTELAKKADKTVDFANLIIDNGYTKLPNGLIIQWGTILTTRTSLVTSIDFNYPIAFPQGKTFSLQVSISDATADFASFNVTAKRLSASQGSARIWDLNNNANGTAIRFDFVAIGI